MLYSNIYCIGKTSFCSKLQKLRSLLTLLSLILLRISQEGVASLSFNFYINNVLP